MEENTNIWWLNEESEQMLNRGYLLKGETVQGAIERITTAAAKRLYKPELQPAFEEMITKGWIFFVARLGEYGNSAWTSDFVFQRTYSG
jgi:ribonucleoside-diphosphate reductase alpha chain